MCGIKYLNQRRRAGFGLVDFMVALALSTIILAVIGALSSYTARSFAAVANYVDLDQRSQSALDQMTRDIRQVNGLLSYTVSGTSKTLTFQDSDGLKLWFTYDSAARTLTRGKAGLPLKTLLTECDQLDFGIYQRNPVSGSYDEYPAGTPTTCKLIQVSWTCSRKIFGATVNTESVQTAKIVIRKARVT